MGTAVVDLRRGVRRGQPDSPDRDHRDPRAEVPQSIRVASWLATALLVIATINGVAVVLRRWARPQGWTQRTGHPPPLAPLWPLRGRDERLGESLSP